MYYHKKMKFVDLTSQNETCMLITTMKVMNQYHKQNSKNMDVQKSAIRW